MKRHLRRTLLCTMALGAATSCAPTEDSIEDEAIHTAEQALEDLDVRLDSEWSVREIFNVLHDHKASTGRAGVISRDRGAPVPGGFMIAFESGTLDREVSRVLEAARDLGAEPGDVVMDSELAVAAVTIRKDEDDVLARLVLEPSVFFIEADGMTTANAPNGWDRTDERRRPLDNLLDPPIPSAPSGAPLGRQRKETGKGVRVYVVDSGIDANHLEFQPGQVVAGEDEVGDDALLDCFNGTGHGTGVASVIGGGGLGGAFETTLVSVRVKGCSAAEGTEYDLYQGFHWVKSNGTLPAVANSSIIPTDGGGVLLRAAVANTHDKGITVVFGAGNSDTNPCNAGLFKKEADKILIVGAADPDRDARSEFFQGASNFGPCIDLFAPGNAIAKALVGPQGQSEGEGTSLAAPHASAVAALYLQGHPDAPPSEVMLALLNGSTKNELEPTSLGAGSPNRLLYYYTPESGGDAGYFPGDFDGDGKTDVLRHIGGYTGADVFLSNGSTFLRSGSWTSAGFGPIGWTVGDFNGDGRSDLLRKVGNSTTNQVLLSNGTSFGNAQIWLTANPGLDGWHVGDYNGDGRDDLLRHTPGSPNRTDVFISDGTQFIGGFSWTQANDGDNGFYIGRFNTDVRSDIGVYRNGTGTTVGLSNGTAFGFFFGVWTPAGDGDLGFFIGDYNGDGRDDLLRSVGNSTQVLLSTASSFGSPTQFVAMSQGPESRVGDFTGDGRADIFASSRGSLGAFVFRSTGSSFNLTRDWTLFERD